MGRAGQGRPARATALKVIDGDRPDRINQDEPRPKERKIEPPGTLSKRALKVWRRYAPDLIDKGVLTYWDREEFGVWCDCIAKFEDISETMADPGFRYLVQGDKGNMVRNPLLMVHKQLTDTILRYGARFGLTPSDRTGISVGQKGDAKGAARLLT